MDNEAKLKIEERIIDMLKPCTTRKFRSTYMTWD